MKEKPQGIDIKYTICFCTVSSQGKVLMLLRSNSPNKGKLNGLGGKIQENEEHKDAVIREIIEEAEIDISKADFLNYVGIVTWKGTRKDGDYFGGMHAYVADFDDQSIMFGTRETREGVLDWHDINEIISKDNKQVVENITHFLPIMLDGRRAQYHCTYVDDELTNFEVFPLQ